MPSHLIFLGTYTRTTSRGIYAVRLDAETGALGTPRLAAELENPTWIEFSPDRKLLYAVHESDAQAVAYRVDATNGTLSPAAPLPPPAGGKAPSHLALDATGRVLLAANYHGGFVAAAPIRDDGTPGPATRIQHEGNGPHPSRQEKPHPHSVTVSPDNRFAIVCDLGVDKIFSYALDIGRAQLTPAATPFVETAPGAGPRHFKFGPTGRHAYAINELNNTIAAYTYTADRGTLTPLEQRAVVSTLPPDFSGENTTAEVRLHPNGRFLYGSNRGHDSLAVFAIDPASGALEPVQIVPSGGKTPRNFALSPDGRWLVCAHQDSEELPVFHVNAANGQLTRAPHTTTVPMAVCVLFYP
jgi:6-phosphogluconolactonase